MSAKDFTREDFVRDLKKATRQVMPSARRPEPVWKWDGRPVVIEGLYGAARPVPGGWQARVMLLSPSGILHGDSECLWEGTTTWKTADGAWVEAEKERDEMLGRWHVAEERKRQARRSDQREGAQK